ncbi:hypothetical protein U5801_26950 [Lamprobacter modestohalophilus]|uniref:hypothetical protein n=1 Tax=Lamprobacter modestohalophilus TaxID=1064514 RepID=UPI002ADEA7F0|nr:hypothetical protein [Lamprobacter modestohalophilus]MEA1053415.1 hypothetical protein [Lamprobacter modestohalophilus]
MSEPGLSTIGYHRAHPEVTTDQYVHTQRIQLGREVCAKRKIYLDTKFWILLRDVLLRRNVQPELVELLSTLNHGVRAGTLLCPISATTFFEIYKQQDTETRQATVALVDQLSLGVTIADHFERARTELSYLLNSFSGSFDLHDLDHLVWNKVSFVLGVSHPTDTPFSEDEERAIQKAFFDHMWSLPMATMEDHLGGKRFLSMDYDGLAEKLNAANAAHAHECRSFEQLYRNEFMGGIETSAPVVEPVMERWYAKVTGRQEYFDPSLATQAENTMLSILSEAIKKNDFRSTLRTAHIGALCHASLRWDKKRKLDGNWLHDFHHAEAAVGYCDLFLTEKPLAVLLKQKHLKLDEVFSCEVISSPPDAVRAVAKTA